MITSTLIGLLLSMDYVIKSHSRNPVILSSHPMGRRDGRCVLLAGAYSTRAIDANLKGVSGSIPTTLGSERIASPLSLASL